MALQVSEVWLRTVRYNLLFAVFWADDAGKPFPQNAGNTRRHTPDDSKLYAHSRESMRSRIFNFRALLKGWNAGKVDLERTRKEPAVI